MENVKEVVSQAKQGDSAAFAALYEEYSPTIYRFLRRRLDGPDEAVEDLTEDVFVKVYQKLDRYEERGLPFTAWLYRIAHNQLVDYLRSQPRVSAYSLDDAAVVESRDSRTAFGRVLDRAAIDPALERLTDEQRQAVQLRFLDGLSVADTATLMGRSEDAVTKLQARALANLRRLLTASGLTEVSVGVPHQQYAVA